MIMVYYLKLDSSSIIGKVKGKQNLSPAIRLKSNRLERKMRVIWSEGKNGEGARKRNKE